MANSYKSSIGISITLDPQNKVKSDLEQLLNKLSQTNKLNISIDSQINQQMKEVSNNLSNIYNQTNKPISLSSLTKSAEESAKIFETLGEQIGKIREKSELKTKQIDRSQEIAQAKAINTALEEGYTIEQKQVEAYKQIEVMKANGIISSSDISKLEQMVKDANSLKSINSALNSVMSTSMMKESSIVGITKQLAEAQNKLEKMKKTFGEKLPQNFVESTESEINKLKTDLTKVDGMNFNGIKNSLNQLNNDMKLVSEQAKSSEGFFSKLGNTLKNVGIYIDITDIVRGVSNGIKEAVDVTISMDTALGNLNKVVSMSSSQLLQMRDSAIEMGKELGRSSIEVANAQAEFGRLYKTQNEINDMTKVSVMGANVMDGVSSAEVAKGLTTVVSSMKLEAKDSMSILDSMNEIQNNYRVGASDLLNALSEVGSTAYTSGASLQQVEGYITSIATATGESGSEVGTALRTIMSRIYSIGRDGIEAAGLPEKTLKQVGVAVRDESGQFRNFSNILEDLNSRWSSLTKTEQIAVAQKVGGVQRYNQFISLLNNYKTATDSTNTALNSQGSALKENEIHMSTAEAKLGTLKATTEEFYMKLINSDAIKSGIDGLTSLVSTFGNMPTIIGLATSAIVAFSGKALISAIASVGGYITSLISLASTEGVVATATTELSLIMSTNPFGLIAIAIASLTVGLVALNHSVEESTNYIVKMNEATKGLQELKSTENLVKQYNDLNSTINSTSSTVEQVTSAKEKLLSVQKQLASQNPELVDGYTKEGDALVRNIKLIEEKITKDKKALGAEAESNYGKLINQVNSKQMNKFTDTTTDSVWWLPNTWKSDIESYNNLLKESESSENGLSENRKNKLTELSTKFGDLNKAIITMKDNGQDISGKQMFDFSTGKLVDAVQYLKDIENESTQTTNKTKVLTEANKELQSSNGKLSADTIKKIAEVYPEVGDSAEKAKAKVDELNNAVNQKQNTSMEDLTKSFSESVTKAGDLREIVEKLNKSQKLTPDIIKSVAEAIPDIGTKITSVQGVQEALNQKIKEEEQVQIDTYKAMVGNDTEYYNSKIKNNSETQSAIGSILAQYVNVDEANGLATSLKNFTTAEQAKAEVSRQIVKSIAGMWAEYWDSVTSDFGTNAQGTNLYGGMDLSGKDTDTEQFQAKTKQYEQMVAMRDKIRSAEKKLDGALYTSASFTPSSIDTPEISGSGSKSDASKALKEATEKEKTYLDDLGSKYEATKDMITQNLSSIELAQKDLGASTDDNYLQRVDLLNQKLENQKWLVQEAQENLDAYSNASVTTADAQEELTKDIKSANTELQAQQKSLAEVNQELKTLATDQIKTLLEQQQKLEEQTTENYYNDQIDSIDALTESLEKKNDALTASNALQEQENTLAEAKTKLANLKKQKTVRTYSEGSDGKWQYKYTANKDAVASAKKDVESAKSALESTKSEAKLKEVTDILSSMKQILQAQLNQAKSGITAKYADSDALAQSTYNNYSTTWGSDRSGMMNAIMSDLKSTKSQLSTAEQSGNTDTKTIEKYTATVQAFIKGMSSDTLSGLSEDDIAKFKKFANEISASTSGISTTSSVTGQNETNGTAIQTTGVSTSANLTPTASGISASNFSAYSQELTPALINFTNALNSAVSNNSLNLGSATSKASTGTTNATVNSKDSSGVTNYITIKEISLPSVTEPSKFMNEFVSSLGQLVETN